MNATEAVAVGPSPGLPTGGTTGKSDPRAAVGLNGGAA